MKRKITQTGPASMGVTLPKHWIRAHDLQAGADVSITESEGNLVLSVQRPPNQEQQVLYEPLLFQDMLEKLYRQHTPLISVFAKEPLPDSILEVIKQFPGLTVTQHEENKLVLAQTLEPVLQSPSAVRRRVYRVLNAFFERNPGSLEDVEELLFLSGLYEKDSREQESLRMILNTLKSLDRPVFDDLHAYVREVCGLVYKQKYDFSRSRAQKLEHLFAQQETLFATYFTKEDPVVAGKLLHCLRLFESLHRTILTNQSLEKLRESQPDETKPFRVGVCLKNNANAFWRDYVMGAMKESQKEYRDISFVYRAPFTYPDIEAQIGILEDFIAEGVDAIIVAPLHPTKLEEILVKIKQAGISLVLIDTEVESEVKHTYIGWDNSQGGQLVATYLQEHIKPLKVLVVEGEQTGNFRERASGFTESINCEVDIIQADFQQSVAYKKSLAYLREHDVDAVFATSDNMALGVLQACNELSITLPICGFDATSEVRSLIDEGTILCSVDDQPQVLGSLAVEAAAKQVTGKPVSSRIVYDVQLYK